MSESPRYSILSALGNLKSYSLYLLSFIAIVTFLFLGTRQIIPSTPSASSIANFTSYNSFAVSIDQVSESFLVSRFAAVSSLPSSDVISDNFTSLNIIYELAKGSDGKLDFPNIIDTSNIPYGIAIEYVFKSGDSLDAIAKQYGVSTTDIRWSNNLKNNNVAVGTRLFIPTRPGILYTVRSGDTIDSLVARYKTNYDEFVAFNNLDIKGLQVGATVLLPSGQLPERERPEFVAPTPRPQPSVATGRNTYAYGWCTWYAADKRARLGRPIPNSWGNAATWLDRAARDGWQVSRARAPGGSVPRVGAIMHNYADGSFAGRFGHVAIVESIVPGKSVTVSEMNWVGWGRVSTRTVTWARATKFYNYIY